ncbi:Gfo/Idh/MocA family protein [Halobaculum lipolyticum]|uniref:Gfo/Idh/MocA family protein n=1 Tax=Halobaculum lipolyticum TaxID=3032001 RepID=A0ABD5WFH8_9EURY|nr:Gfo/Idh/MocA family oxidoreductase [Halobaculum sp. DT31]
MTWRVLGANFDQMHMNTNLTWVRDHPDLEIVGVCDEVPATSTGSLTQAVEECDLTPAQVYENLDEAIKATEPDIVMGGPMNTDHGAFVERVAAHDVHIVIEKPMASSLADADRMLKAMPRDRLLFINWPTMWDPVKHTVKRLVDEGAIGDIVEVQYYGGNAAAPPSDSWFYDADAGGGSLLDYLGYGATFTTWFRDGELPNTVSAETYVPPDQEVDFQSVSTCGYTTGLSTLQTTWRMLTNPWEVQPQPAKGYELVGTDGTISTRDREAAIRVTTTETPEGYAVEPDELPSRYRDLAYYLVDRLEGAKEPEGPAAPEFCREAQRIIETAQRSASEGERLTLVG